jgi:murein DD-endopeptidase MepM/ murein hydrolase activator NlpD
VPLRGNRLLDPRSDTDLFELAPRVPGEPIGLKFEYQYIHGDPGARHQPSEPYRLPYAQASRYRVSQAYPDAVTHADRANLNAVDFEMPVGTNVFAARAGVVIEVATDYYEAGMEERLASRANMIRILHEDGTFALYGHLNWNTIRVVPGQKVTRGEYIADSGNTGFSSGPHLHFVVQRNIGGEVASVPVEFAAAGGGTSTLATGDEPVAY